MADSTTASTPQFDTAGAVANINAGGAALMDFNAQTRQALLNVEVQVSVQTKLYDMASRVAQAIAR